MNNKNEQQALATTTNTNFRRAVMCPFTVQLTTDDVTAKQVTEQSADVKRHTVVKMSVFVCIILSLRQKLR